MALSAPKCARVLNTVIIPKPLQQWHTITVWALSSVTRNCNDSPAKLSVEEKTAPICRNEDVRRVQPPDGFADFRIGQIIITVRWLGQH